jgi:hypothetical protein
MADFNLPVEKYGTLIATAKTFNHTPATAAHSQHQTKHIFSKPVLVKRFT